MIFSAQKMFAGMAPHSDELSEFRSGDEVSKRWEYIRTLDYVQTRWLSCSVVAGENVSMGNWESRFMVNIRQIWRIT